MNNGQDKILLRRAGEAMWNNDPVAAENMLKGESGTNPKFALALSEVHWANSILSGTEDMLKKTLSRLSSAMILAERGLADAKSAHDVDPSVKKKNIRDMQVILADANFLSAAMMAATGQKVSVAWHTRKAWKLYLTVLQSGRDEKADATLARLFRADRVPVEEGEARAMFGVGSCLVAMSWLPRSTVTAFLAQLAGFTMGKREEGLKMLTRVAESASSVRAPLAYTVLLMDLLFMPHGIKNSRDRRELAKQLMFRALERWPRSPTFHWMAAAEARKAGMTESALRHIDEATQECLATGAFEAVPYALTTEKASLMLLARMLDGAALLSKQCFDAMARDPAPKHGKKSDSDSSAERRNLYQVRCELTLAQAHALMGEDEEALRITAQALERHCKRRESVVSDRDKGLLGVLQAGGSRPATKVLLPPYELLVITRDAAHLSATDARAFLMKLQSRFEPLRASATEAEVLLYRLVCGSLKKTCACGCQDGPPISETTLQSEEAEAKHDLTFVATVSSRRATAARLPYCVAALAYYELADIAAIHGDANSACSLLKKASKSLPLPCTSGNAQYVNSEIISPRVKRALDEYSQ